MTLKLFKDAQESCFKEKIMTQPTSTTRHQFVTHHSFRVESTQPLQLLFPLQLSFALLSLQTSVSQLLQQLMQLLVDLRLTLVSLLQLHTQTLLLLTVLFKRRPETLQYLDLTLFISSHTVTEKRLERFSCDALAGPGVLLQLLCSSC